MRWNRWKEKAVKDEVWYELLWTRWLFCTKIRNTKQTASLNGTQSAQITDGWNPRYSVNYTNSKFHDSHMSWEYRLLRHGSLQPPFFLLPPKKRVFAKITNFFLPHSQGRLWSLLCNAWCKAKKTGWKKIHGQKIWLVGRHSDEKDWDDMQVRVSRWVWRKWESVTEQLCLACGERR